MKPYLLRIMDPGTTEDVLDDFESDSPFSSISVGDLLDLEQYQRAIGRPVLLRVVCLEHKLFQGENIGFRHYIRAFTEEVPDNPEMRLGSG